MSRIATLLFIIIIVAALAANWDVFITNLGSLGPALIALIVVLLTLGLTLARMAGLPWDQSKTISVETGIQNATLGGGGYHGYNALEGTFLGGCIFSGRAAGRSGVIA